MSDNSFCKGDWINVIEGLGNGITPYVAYQVIETKTKNRLVRFRDDDGDLRTRAWQSVIPAGDNAPATEAGAEEYDLIMEGQKAWASIQKNSGN